MSGYPVNEFDLRDPPMGFVDDPFPWYAALRDDAPVRKLPDGSVLITGYHACIDIYKNDTFVSDKRNLFLPKFGNTPLYEHHTTSLVFNDPPYHSRVRRTLIEALKPRSIQSTVDMLSVRVEELLGELSDQLRDGATVDLIDAYASRIPVEVICDLLTVPSEDREELRRWSLAILGALEPAISTAQLEDGNRAVEEFLRYLRELIRYRRRNPTTGHSVLSTLLAQHDTGELSEIELLHNCIFLLNAGHETTTNLIGNGVHLLLTHPEQKRKLLADPGRTRTAVEEVLRFQSPNQLGNREAARPITLHGYPFDTNDQVTLCIGAANRDPQRFPDPNEFRVDRTPNPHIAFAAGAHTCAGMALARIEGKIALGSFFAAFPTATLAAVPTYRNRLRFRGLQSLRVAVSGPR